MRLQPRRTKLPRKFFRKAPQKPPPIVWHEPARDRVRINLPTLDGQRVTGVVVSYNTESLRYVDAEEVERQAAWSRFEASMVERFYPRLVQSRDTEAWYRLVEILVPLPDGEASALRVARRLERMDPENPARLAEVYEWIEQGGVEVGPAHAEEDDDDDDHHDGGVSTDITQPAIENPEAWPPLTPEQIEAAVERLEGFVGESMDTAEMRLDHTQTDRFIVYTDLPRDEAHYWVSLLDRMYVKLCEVFDLDPQANIWNGKCVLMMFHREQDYLQYAAKTWGADIRGSAGVCFQMRNGDVHILMYRNNRRDQLAHTLVHEAAHGFLFRYQSSYHVDNWLNEGLAEYLAESLLQDGGSEERVSAARRYVRGRGRLDNFLTARNIIGPHYGLAYDLTQLMIEENRRGYVRMIQGIKQGLSTQEAFDEHYGVSIPRVMQYYAKTRLQMDSIQLD